MEESRPALPKTLAARGPWREEERPPSPEARSFSAGDIIADRYALVALLGEGGMGEVWRARQVDTGLEVALKLLRDFQLAAAETEILRARFRQEAQVLATLENPRVVKILDHGETADGLLFIAMELLEGSTLEDRLRASGPMSVDATLRLLAELAEGVGAAHAIGLIHRDLKPGNIFLTSGPNGEEVVRILDFGIAKSLEEGDILGVPKTKTGTFLGSPHYMAPEQFEGRPDPRTDIYALGVIAWECLAGRRPFTGSAASVIGKHLMQEPPDFPADLGVPGDVAHLVLEMLE